MCGWGKSSESYSRHHRSGTELKRKIKKLDIILPLQWKKGHDWVFNVYYSTGMQMVVHTKEPNPGVDHHNPLSSEIYNETDTKPAFCFLVLEYYTIDFKYDMLIV